MQPCQPSSTVSGGALNSRIAMPLCQPVLLADITKGRCRGVVMRGQKLHARRHFRAHRDAEQEGAERHQPHSAAGDEQRGERRQRQAELQRADRTDARQHVPENGTATSAPVHRMPTYDAKHRRRQADRGLGHRHGQHRGDADAASPSPPGCRGDRPGPGRAVLRPRLGEVARGCSVIVRPPWMPSGAWMPGGIGGLRAWRGRGRCAARRFLARSRSWTA